MDYFLDVLFPRHEISQVNLSEVWVEWGGESFHQVPAKFTNHSKLSFTECMDRAFYKRFLDDSYLTDSMIALYLPETLTDLEFAINRKEDFLNHEVMRFLSQLVKLEKFAILLIRDEEWIDDTHQISGTEELQAIVRESLSWSNPKGVVITKRK